MKLRIKKVLYRIAAVTTLLAPSAALKAKTFSFAALGDTAYITPRDYPIYEQLIRNINQQPLALTIHVGDLWGAGPCSNANMERQKKYFDSFEQPLIYTPGDNEWVDCHRINFGGFAPLERLNVVRETFFHGTQSLGKQAIALNRQSEDPAYKTYVENARWQHADVMFATVHVVGSNNNAGKQKEFLARDNANAVWIDALFQAVKSAKANTINAVVIALHADMFGLRNAISPAYKNTAERIVAGAKATGLPILLIHGDSHQYIVDTPFKAAANITRLQVYGFPDIKAVKVNVDTSAQAAATFSFTPISATTNSPPKTPLPAKK